MYLIPMQYLPIVQLEIWQFDYLNLVIKINNIFIDFFNKYLMN